MTRIKANRRNFLKMGLGGTAAAVAAPYVFVPKRARASFDYGDKDNHLIILNLDGGARTVPMFNAGVSGRYNPYGEHASAAAWSVGGVFANAAIPFDVATGLTGSLPSITDIATDIAVSVAMDHTPDSASGEGSHTIARNWIASGYNAGGPGIMSHIMKRHAYYGAEVAEFGSFPPVVIGGGDATTPFARPAGDTEPLKTTSFAEFASQSGDGDAGEQQPDWARAFEAGLDNHMRNTHSASDRTTMSRLALGKDAVEHFRSVFTDPALKVEAEPTAEKYGYTNAQLAAIFGTSTFGRNAALATRFLMEGSTAMVIGDNGWDTHSNEMSAFTTSAQTLERVLCGFNYLLKNLPHPAGGTYWDRTIVCTVSEFGRDNMMGSGYNSGGGSDHTGTPAMRNQAWFMMGGAAAGGMQLGQTNTDDVSLVGGSQVYSTQNYLATWLAWLDIDHEDVFPGSTPIEDFFV
ncbi:MAG: DUF1501 domain-containing protein [Nannocystaceae bacterium]|nr:DUF1501 domain-containing protein [Nannocystaceae bacterium]